MRSFGPALEPDRGFGLIPLRSLDQWIKRFIGGLMEHVELNELRSLFMKMGSKATRVPLEGGAGARISEGGVLGVFKSGKH